MSVFVMFKDGREFGAKNYDAVVALMFADGATEPDVNSFMAGVANRLYELDKVIIKFEDCESFLKELNRIGMIHFGIFADRHEKDSLGMRGVKSGTRAVIQAKRRRGELEEYAGKMASSRFF